MKGTALIIVSAIAFASGNTIRVNQNGCPLDITTEKLMPHENCNKYYHCTHGDLITKSCPKFLVFNDLTQECDWPTNVDCGNRYISVDEDTDTDNHGNGDDNGSGSGNSNVGNCDPSEAPALCAADGSDGVLVANERCDRYYKCSGGIPVSMKCPKGTLYNPHLEFCDWPENVKCEDRTIPDDKDSKEDKDNSSEDSNDKVCNCSPGEAPVLCAADGSDGVFVANERCDKFYTCSGGKPVAMKCPKGTLYNPHLEFCDWPENVKCEDRTIPDDKDSKEDKDNSGEDIYDKVCNCSPGEAPVLCAADGSDGVFVANEQCDRYYTCSGGKPIAMKCPKGTLYNPHQEFCDWPENVQCEGRTIPDGKESEESKETENGHGNENGNGNGSGNGSGGNCDPSEAPVLCAADGSDGVFVANERCDKFYTCSGGRPVAMKCPKGTLYNPHQEFCDWPENVQCEERTIPDDKDSKEDKDNSSEDSNDKVCNCSPGEAPALCAADGSDGVFVANERCDKFYTCSGGKPIAMKCPKGTLYNPHLEFCDWPENVQCEDRTIPDDKDSKEDRDNSGEDSNDKVCNCSPSEAPVLCAADGSDGVLVANERCDKFYTCSGGRPVAMKCPKGTLYNPHLEFCDWPENVQCENRTIPDDKDSKEDKDNSGEDSNDKVCNCSPGEAPVLCAADGSDGVFVANEQCDRYYTCSGGKPVAMKCPKGTLYNPHQEFCDWPENVQCENRTIPDDKDSKEDKDSSSEDSNDKVCNCSPGEAPALCAADGSDGVFVANERCDKFYTCSGGKPVAMKCPKGTLYNPHLEFCDWPENVKCEDRTIPDDKDSKEDKDNSGEDIYDKVCNCSPGEAPVLCAADGSDGVFVANEQCDRYYTCSGGKPIAMKCPKGTLYNPHQEFCDWPENVQCEGRTIPDGKESEESKETENGHGNENGDGNESGNGSGGNCDPSEAPVLCAADGSDGVLVANERCDRYYKCSGGVPVSMKCPPGTLYHPHQEFCDWPENVQCENRTIPDDKDSKEDKDNSNEDSNDKVCNCSPGEAPALCAADGSDGVFVANEQCDRYYTCSGGKPVAMKCPKGTLYNPHQEFCDWPENVQCEDRIIPDGKEIEESKIIENGHGNENGDGNGNESGGNCDPSEAPVLCAADGSDGVFVANEQCDRYYTCSGGKPVAMKCPKGTLYNPHQEFCDWPENVQCENRTIPDDKDSKEDKDNSGEDSNDKLCNCSPGEAPTLCAADGSDGVFVANEQCDRYYTCSGGKPVAMKCPKGTLYNPHQEFCDWPENVQCEDRTIPDDKDSKEDKDNSSEDSNDKVCNCSPGEAPVLCAAEGSDGVFVANEQCDRYYTCSGGKPIAMKCPKGTLYNPYLEFCDWPENVQCENRTIPDDKDSKEDKDSSSEDSNDKVCNCSPDEAPVLCAAEGSDGVFVANEQCDQYYTCSGGKPVAMKCPKGTLYNPHQEFCDWPENVQCEDRTIPDDKDSKEDKDNSSEDSNDKVCNCSPGEAPTLCAADGSDGVFVANEQCDRYYTCSGGKPVAMKCPKGTLYNPHQEFCDWPENVQCEDRTIPDGKESEESIETENGHGNENGNGNESGNGSGGNCDPSEAPVLCAADGSDGVFVANEQCDKYYTCSGGKPVAMKCPKGTLYNPHQEFCDWPENVKCEDRTIPDDKDSKEDKDNSGEDSNDKVCNCSPGEAPALCAAASSDGTLVAHEQCNKFYICSGGAPVTMRCPVGLLYNPYLEYCDWPFKVKCGGRNIADIQ